MIAHEGGGPSPRAVPTAPSAGRTGRPDPPSGRPADLADASAGARTLVIVEDDEKLAALMARALRRIGLVSTIATTGDGALAAMRNDPPVAVILDVMIPHPDGIEVCRQFRRDGFQGPILVTSARDSSIARSSAQSAGADAFLGKPFRLTEVLDTVRLLLDAERRPTGLTSDPA